MLAEGTLPWPEGLVPEALAPAQAPPNAWRPAKARRDRARMVPEPGSSALPCRERGGLVRSRRARGDARATRGPLRWPRRSRGGACRLRPQRAPAQAGRAAAWPLRARLLLRDRARGDADARRRGVAARRPPPLDRLTRLRPCAGCDRARHPHPARRGQGRGGRPCRDHRRRGRVRASRQAACGR